VSAIVDFGRDVWDASAGRIRRADPLLMGAAIAYNALFALVPLTIAFAAILTFFDATDRVLTEFYELLRSSALPPELMSFVIELLQQSTEWIEDSRGLILVLALLVALWSGSRAVYAIQKALRMAEGIEDERGYLVTRGLGILVTFAACFGVLIAYFVALTGGRVGQAIQQELGVDALDTARTWFIAIAIVFVWLLLWAIYRWGPPRPEPLPGVTAAIVGALLVIGSLVAFSISPDTSSSSLSFLGVVGVFLIWLYYIGIVIVAAPTLVNASVGAIAERRRR
jgi:membrane protein